MLALNVLNEGAAFIEHKSVDSVQVQVKEYEHPEGAIETLANWNVPSGLFPV